MRSNEILIAAYYVRKDVMQNALCSVIKRKSANISLHVNSLSEIPAWELYLILIGIANIISAENFR